MKKRLRNAFLYGNLNVIDNTAYDILHKVVSITNKGYRLRTRRKGIMKKAYYTPVAEKLEFDYKEAVVASAKIGCQPMNLSYWDGQSEGSSFCRHVVQHYNGDM